jgi:hypothetical protein
MDDILQALYNILILFTGFSAIICAALTAVAMTNIAASSMLSYRDDKMLLAWSFPTGLCLTGITLIMLGVL